MNTENKDSKCLSCVCTGCDNFKNNTEKEAQLEQVESISQTATQ
ncbi:hypothetical protein JCM19298_1248 [Nonlabens ulvanivorans]|nr:hypothetical protein [Nonlabens ulvanivorans]GAK93911.1 hypothetical protein JCM19298_1248 [Nonlabens ulvanivorans]